MFPVLPWGRPRCSVLSTFTTQVCFFKVDYIFNMPRLALKIKSIKVKGNPPPCNYKWSERYPTPPGLCASFVCPNMSMKQPIVEEYVALEQPARAAPRLFSTFFFFFFPSPYCSQSERSGRLKECRVSFPSQSHITANRTGREIMSCEPSHPKSKPASCSPPDRCDACDREPGLLLKP